jgi:hypothetical protein
VSGVAPRAAIASIAGEHDAHTLAEQTVGRVAQHEAAACTGGGVRECSPTVASETLQLDLPSGESWQQGTGDTRRGTVEHIQLGPADMHLDVYERHRQRSRIDQLGNRSSDRSCGHSRKQG